MNYYSIDWSMGYPSISGEHLDISTFVSNLTDRQVTLIMDTDSRHPVGAEFLPMPLVKSDKPLWLYQSGIHSAWLDISNLTSHLKFYPEDQQALNQLENAKISFDKDFNSLIDAFRSAENLTQDVRFEIDNQDRWPINP